MMILEHITSIENAKNIVETGKFICAYRDPLASDACLNCLNGSSANQPAASGVILRFHWAGQPAITGATRPLAPNSLYDEGAWRLVVPIGTTKNLTFDSVEITSEEAFDVFLNDCTPWHQKLLCNWRLSERKKLLAWFVSKKGVCIEVGWASSCCSR